MINESSLTDLYTSAVQAFPRTTLRQHATQPVRITNIHWTPYLGMRTLFVRGLAQSEGKEYNPIILFKGVNYKVEEVIIAASNGKEYGFQKLSPIDTEVLVRCNCPDFRWRFAWYLGEDLYGSKPKKYTPIEGSNRPPANPLEMPGICKHVMSLSHALSEAGLFK
jgi:hypothetical protein